MKLPEPRQLPDGRWWMRYSAPPGPDGKRRQPRVYGRTAKECRENYVKAMGDLSAGRHVDDRRTKFAEHLDRRLRWWESEGDIMPSTMASYREAVSLYLQPGLGHVRLADLRDHHFRDLAAAMRKINTPAAGGDPSDMLRRLLDVRATRDGKRISTRPLTDARIRRVLAVASSALGSLVPNVLPTNPAAGVKAGKSRRRKPLLWTEARIERWRETGEIPDRVMVWDEDQCGAFLDAILNERLYAIFHVAAYWGLRRSELAGLEWADVDLTRRRFHIRQAQVDDELDDTKSEDSERFVAFDADSVDVLKAWRKAQLAERLAWHGVWTNSGRVFSREDGTPLRPEWISQRFDTLVTREKLPPITLHGLRHGSATMQLAAGIAPKVVSQNLGHATVAFTMDTYTQVLEELLDDAAEALAAFVPRKSKITAERAKTVPNGSPNDH